jgi:hypothetical protein
MSMTESSRKHDKSHFFKFASFDVGKLIIENKSFQWSSPLKFNDPFDTQTGFSLDINEIQFAKLITDSAIRMIYSDDQHENTELSTFAKLLLLMRKNRHKFQRDELYEKTYVSSLQTAQILASSIENFNALILAYLQEYRIFCISEKVDNVVMWSHYAEKHQGIAFQLGCVDELDNVLLAAKKIDYADNFVAFPSAEDYAIHLTGEKPINMVKLVEKLAYIKHTDWKYEKEWRVRIPTVNKFSETGVSLHAENPQIFQAMYLGCNMNNDNALNIISLARRELPNMKIYKALRSKKSYELEFALVS